MDRGRTTDSAPLVLLDVDGVINDLRALYSLPVPHEIEVIVAYGYEIHVPVYMPSLIQGLVTVAEVWWCTTWEHRANDEIRAHLGIDPLPVIELAPGPYPKAEAAGPLLEEARVRGRSRYWIEDFDGYDPPVPPGTVLVDTTEAGVLRRVDLPPELRMAGAGS